MARYEHLKIFKAMFDFMVYYSKLMNNFDKDYKHTIGQKLLNSIADAVVEIYKINNLKSPSDRLEHTSVFEEKIQYINLYIRLAFALKAINSEKYNNCAKYMLDVEKQLTGWKNYIQKTVDKKEVDETSITVAPCVTEHGPEQPL